MFNLKFSLTEFGFLLGLLLYTLGQFLIFVVFHQALHTQSPIDFAHWALFIGVLFLIPQIGCFLKTKVGWLGVPVLTLGIGLIIGMCVIDFIFWSMGTGKQVGQFASHVSNVQSIWFPFMTISGKIFTFGLIACGLTYFNLSKVGSVFCVIGGLIVYLPTGWDNIIGYSIIFVGYSICFIQSKDHPVVKENEISHRR